MKNKLFKGILIGCGILFLAAGSVLGSGAIAKSAQANDMAPDFTLTGVDGQTVCLKDYQGRGIILFFFTTWCPHCQDKFPMLINEYEAIKKDGLDLLVIDVGESEVKVKSYAQKQNAPFAVLLDSNMDVAKAYGVMGVPSFFLINKEGKIVNEGHELPGNYRSLLGK
jgi:peroxiredoxin